MTVCPQCGARNAQDEQFCGACGTYLEWEEGAPAPEGDAEPPLVEEQPPGHAPGDVPAPETAPGRASLDPAPAHATLDPAPAHAPLDPAPAHAPLDPAPAHAPLDPTPERGRLDQPAPGRGRPDEPAPEPTPPGAGQEADTGGTGAAAQGAVPAAALVATPPPPPPAPARQPAAVRPGVPRPAPAPRRLTDEAPPAPGDLVCGDCGAGNSPTRKFCRRCGGSLAEARVQPRRSWWSRLWRPEPRLGPAAGHRPRQRRRFPTRVVVTVLVLGALVVAALSLRPELERARIAVLDRVQGNVAVNPVTVTASSELAERPAAQARDGATNLAWSPADRGDGVGQYLEMSFSQPFRLTRVLVHAGPSDVEKEFLAGSSPHVLVLTATTAAGTQQEVELALADRVGLQSVAVGIDDVVQLRLTISSTYRATPQTHVAIAEVELRGRT